MDTDELIDCLIAAALLAAYVLVGMLFHVLLFQRELDLTTGASWLIVVIWPAFFLAALVAVSAAAAGTIAVSLGLDQLRWRGQVRRWLRETRRLQATAAPPRASSGSV